MVAKHPTKVGHDAGTAAGRAFAAGFAREMQLRQLRGRGRRGSSAELARLNRALAAHRGRFA